MDFDSVVDELSVIYTVEDARAFLHSMAPEHEYSKAMDLCICSHEGVFRKTGELYAVHPILVAALVAFLGGDHVLIQSALLHDVVEDTGMGLDEITAQFGSEVGTVVDGVTKIKKIREQQLVPSSSDEALYHSACTFHNMLIKSIDNVGVLILKLCDRLHNILTLHGLEPAKQKRVAEETLFVFAPIAHKLGMSNIRNTLENESFFYAYPQEYKQINKYFKRREKKIRRGFESFIGHLHTLLRENGFSDEKFQLKSSIKHYYSIYQKTIRQKISIDEVRDLFRVRLLVNTPLSCYKALGVIHLNFKPYLDYFKDHITFSKDNGYQTLHVMVKYEKMNFEIHIRTHDMHKTAEFGITAGWKYKKSGLTPVLDWLDSTEKTPELLEVFYQDTRSDLSVKDIVVSTPDGMPMTLPQGAVCLDFAYLIHTDLGNRAKTATVNGRKSSIFKTLKNGDIVKIQKDHLRPPRFLGSGRVRTALARRHIQQNFRRRKNVINFKTVLKFLSGYLCKSSDEVELFLYEEGIGFAPGRLVKEPALQIEFVKRVKKSWINRLYETPKKKLEKVKEQKVGHFYFFSHRKIKSYRYNDCCHPTWGHPVLGFDRKNGVVEMHDQLCPTAFELLNENCTMTLARWVEIQRRIFNIRVSLLRNETGSLAAFLQAMAKAGVHLRTIQLEDHPSRINYCDFTIETEILDQEIIQALIAPHAKIIDLSWEDY